MLGFLIKTKRTDAKDLARYGHLEGLEPTPPLDGALAELLDVVLLLRGLRPLDDKTLFLIVRRNLEYVPWENRTRR